MAGLAGDSFQNDGGGDDFWKELGCGPVGAKQNVGRDAFAAVLLQGGSDGGVAAGPVGHQKSDIFVAEGSLNFGT